ncbi:MAG: hypothetical protein ACSHX3_11660 [Litorimonas sp.]
MKTVLRSRWTRLVLDAAIVCAVIIGAAYFISADVAATETSNTSEPLTITIEFLP